MVTWLCTGALVVESKMLGWTQWADSPAHEQGGQTRMCMGQHRCDRREL
jgi:hypothetical protein